VCEHCEIASDVVKEIMRDSIHILFSSSSIKSDKATDDLSVIGKVKIDLTKIKLKRDEKMV